MARTTSTKPAKKKNNDFVPMPFWVMERTDLTPAQKIILCTIENLCNNSDKGCYSSNKSLSDMTGLSKGYIANELTILEKSGWLDRESLGNKRFIYPNLKRRKKRFEKQIQGSSIEEGSFIEEPCPGSSIKESLAILPIVRKENTRKKILKEKNSKTSKSKNTKPPVQKSKQKSKLKTDPYHLKFIPDHFKEHPQYKSDFLPIWKKYVHHRKETKKQLTYYGAQALIKELSKHGILECVNEIETAMSRNWQGLFYKDNNGGGNNTALSNKPKSYDILGGGYIDG